MDFCKGVSESEPPAPNNKKNAAEHICSCTPEALTCSFSPLCQSAVRSHTNSIRPLQPCLTRLVLNELVHDFTHMIPPPLFFICCSQIKVSSSPAVLLLLLLRLCEQEGKSGMMIFTASQWQELELQALIFKYMASGTPVPSDLILGVRRSLPTDPLLLQPIPSPKAADPEPGRCRRTDGKKWRCSREAYANSKYCERHMHRGRSRSRKPVELLPPPPPPRPLSLPSPHALNLPLSSSSSRPAPQVDSHREDVSDFSARKAAKLLCFLEERSPKVGTSWMDLDVDPFRISLEHEETSLHLNFNGKY